MACATSCSGPTLNEFDPHYLVFFDESIVDRWAPSGDDGERAKSGKRILVGAVVTPFDSGLAEAVTEMHRTFLADLTHWSFRGTKDRIESSKKHGLHFTEDSVQMRTEAVKKMAMLNFRAHIYYSDLEDDGPEATELQTVMYFNLARSLMLRYAGLRIAMVFENCQSMNSIFGKIVAYATRSLDRDTLSKRKRPRARVAAAIGYKPCGGLSTIDYCLGVANLYLQQQLNDGEKDVGQHEMEMVSRLDPKIAHVVDFKDALHRSGFAILKRPRWAEDILKASSPSVTSRPFSTLIRSSSTGPFEFQETRETLAIALNMRAEDLKEAERLAGIPSSYEFHTLTKKGKTRSFISPKAPLLDLTQRRVADFLRPFSEFLHPSCIGYVPGKGTFDAASPHTGKQWIQRLDIADFYDSTTDERVRSTFLALGAEDEVASVLTKLVTWKGTLPTGIRTSPIVSNLMLGDFDYECATEAKKRDLNYTRYADDLFFSGSSRFDMCDWVDQRLRDEGYSLNRNKTRLRRRGQPLRVAGLTVFDEVQPRIPKALKRRLRLELHLLEKDLHAGRFNPVDSDTEGDLPPEVQAAQDMLAHARGMLRYCWSIEKQFVLSTLERSNDELVELLHFRRPSGRQRSDSVKRLAENITQTQTRSGQLPRLKCVEQNNSPQWVWL